MKPLCLLSLSIALCLSPGCSSEAVVESDADEVNANADAPEQGEASSDAQGGTPGTPTPDAASTSEDAGPWEGDTSEALDVSAEEDSDEEPDSAVEEDTSEEGDAGEEADTGLSLDAEGASDAGAMSDSEAAGDAESASDTQDVESVEDALGDEGDDAEIWTEEEDVEEGPLPCDPPLALSPEVGYATPYGLFLLTPSGGTGAYTFALANPDSAGLLNPISGSYLAPGQVGLSDTILLSDAGCVGEASALIHVVEPFQAIPASVEIAVGQSMTFTTIGGSPEQYFEVVHAPSGGSITPDGLYTAGPVATTDILRAVDAQTGQPFDIIVTVVESASLTPMPATIAMPLGATFEAEIMGGSGYFTLTPSEDIVSVEGTTLTGESPGTTEVSVVDSFTGLETSLNLSVMPPLGFNVERAGDGSYEALTLAPGDIDGDGFNDAIVTLREGDISAVDSGAVYIYAGGPEGIGVEPARVIAPEGRRQFMGRGAAVKDLNGDGLVDLVVGVDGADIGATDIGAVYVYMGVEGLFFEAEPSAELPGVFAYDRAGFAVTVCDFNGDGFEDIASAAPYGEDRDLDGYPSGQGAIYLFLGSEDGFPLEPSSAVFGMVPDAEGTYAGYVNQRFGEQVVSGDIDGDGFCDLAGSTYRRAMQPGSSNDGYVAIYRGRGPSVDGPGGLEPLPSRLIAALDETNLKSQAGRRLAAGDVNGDGLTDIAFGQYLYDVPEASGTNHGVVRLFLGGPLSEEPPAAFEPASGADYSWFGANSGDGFGWYVGIAEVNGEPPLDVLVGSTYGEIPTSTGGAGHVEVFFGAEDALPSETPDLAGGGGLSGDIFGLAATGVGDVTGDGLGDVLSFAGRQDDLGVDVGRPYIISGNPEEEHLKLNLPGEAAGSEVGRDVALVSDLNGDGFPEALVGAPLADRAEMGSNTNNTGAAALYRGDAIGHVTEPAQLLERFEGHSAADRLGQRVDDAGDFDGDGLADIALMARYDDRPGTYPSGWIADTQCSGSYSNGGAVYIFSSVVCGDGVCMSDEDCGSCEADCGACAEKDEGSEPGSAPMIATRPTFVWLGTQVGQSMRAMKAGIDINGDGLKDFISGGLDWDAPGANNAGGFSVVFGRPALVDGAPVAANKTIEICAEDATFAGLRADDYMGGWDGLTSMGYLNDDNCEDFAVGSYVEDFANSGQGTVRVFFGWGGEGCPEEPTYVLLAPLTNGGQSGYSLDGGEDATGDGIPDLLVGGHRLTIDGVTTGAAWLVSGAYIRSLEPELFVSGADPEGIHPYVPTNFGLEGIWRIQGSVDDEYFGASVALVPNMSGPGRAGLAVGGPYGDVGGSYGAGGVRVYRVYEGNQGIDPQPIVEVAGETWRPRGQFGSELSAIESGDGAQLLIGALEGTSVGLDQGSVYSLVLTP